MHSPGLLRVWDLALLRLEFEERKSEPVIIFMADKTSLGAFYEANPSRFDGPPRVIAAGFQLCNGKLIGPRDLFDDPAFDEARRTTNKIANYLRSHGPFEPHRLGLEDLEYTTMDKLMKKLEERFKPE